MLAALNGFLKIVPPVAWLATCVVLLGMFLFNSWRLDDAMQELGKARAAVDRAEEINTQNGTVIADLSFRLDEIVQANAVEEAEFESARLDWSVQMERLRAQAQEVRVEEIEVYRDPTCADLAQLDVGASCPDLAKRLRVRTDSLDRIRNRGSAGASEDSDS